jgi:A/G-specific adenine glycosylase
MANERSSVYSAPVLTDSQVSDFQRTMLDYYQTNGRKFPWRQTKDPYAVLVSEIMLQQTQTDRVLPKYEAWLKRFPTVHSLAAASLSDVLALWSGLGYNRRARFLHEAAKAIAHKGAFPQSPEELRMLPGIGPYTASAVAAFAFNRPEVFIETNIRSVFIFFFFNDAGRTASDMPPVTPVHDREILPLIARTLDRANPRAWYYALMDYGAELKKKVKNPSRNSAHYTKQSAFKGSRREARGAIIRSLSACGKSSLSDIAAREEIDYDRLLKASALLVAEKFIREDGGMYDID